MLTVSSASAFGSSWSRWVSMRGTSTYRCDESGRLVLVADTKIKPRFTRDAPRLSVRLGDALAEAISAEAAKRGCSRNEVVRSLVEAGISEEGDH